MRPHRLEPALRLPTRRNNPLYDPQAAFGGSFTAVGMAAEMTVTGPAVTVGKVAIINKDAIVIQAMSIELLLREVIDREKEARSNSGVLPEIEAVLAEVHDLRISVDHRPAAQCIEAVAGCRSVEQADDMHNRKKRRLTNEPLLLNRLHHAPRVVVVRIFAVGQIGADMVPP